MPKLKTSSSAKKRFRKTGGKSVKIKRAKAYRRHLLTKKAASRKRKLRSRSYVNSSDLRNILPLLPY